MAVPIVLTIIGPDRPGLVERVARTLADHDANWLESRMARLAGKFAGILLASVPESRVEELTRDLRALESMQLRVTIERSSPERLDEPARLLQLELVGLDRPGIIRDISHVLARRGINVEELETECTSAPMSGDALFKASARLAVPAGVDSDELRAQLERLANELMVDITLDEAR